MFAFMCKSYQNSPLNKYVLQKVDLKKYTGKWFEIERFPHSFEKHLKCVTAEYSLLEDNKIMVINSGYNIENPKEFESAEGIAYVPDQNIQGKIKVSFFRPFYGNYWILHLEENYNYALIGDPTLNYLWILARKPDLEEKNIQMLKEKAKEMGFDISRLKKVPHDCSN